METIAPGPAIPENVAAIAGPLLLAHLFQWSLFGALSVQLYNYYTTFPNDKQILKAVVYGIYIVELAQTILVARDCFATYAIGFGNMGTLNNIQTAWISAPILSGVVSCTVQLYYGHRVFILSKSKFLFGIIGTLAVLQSSSAIAQGVISRRLGNLHDIAVKSAVTSGLWLAGTAVCDVIITLSMVYILLRRGSQFPATNSIITRLVLLTVETGVLTAAAATLDLVLLLSFPEYNYHVAVTFTLAKLYSNSLLVLLNNRTQLKRGGVHSIGFVMSVLDAESSQGDTPVTSVVHAPRSALMDPEDRSTETINTEKPLCVGVALAVPGSRRISPFAMNID